MSKILKGLNEVNPNNYDSDWDYQNAVAKSGKSRSNYRSQEDDTSDADIAYSKKMYQLGQKQKRDADHDRLATGTNESARDYTGIYSPEALKLGTRFCEHYNITDDNDIQLAIELIDGYLDIYKMQNIPVDLNDLKSKLASDFRQVYRGMGPGPSFRKKFQEQEISEVDNPWGDQGNFVGDTPQPNIGGATIKQLQVGDTVKYLGQLARIDAMSKTGNTSRITIANKMGGVTQDVLTTDLKRVPSGMAEAGTGLDIDRSIPGRTIARISGDIKHRTGSPSGKKLPDYHPDDDYDQWSGKVDPSIHDDEEDTFNTDYTGDEEGELKEISNEKLAQYKTAAALDAGKADKEGDYKRGDKRFSGIVKATKKQFANDTKKSNISQGMAEADEKPADPFKSTYPRVNNPQILGTPNRAKSAYYPPAKPPVKKLDKPLPENLGNELKSKSLEALQQVKQKLEQQRMADLEQWEKDFKQNTVSKFTAREPNLNQRATSTSMVAMPGEKHAELKARLSQLNKAIEKQSILDNLVQRLDKKGLLTPNIEAGVDTSMLARDGARDNYVELNKKLDKALDYVKNRLLTNKAAYAKPKAIDEADMNRRGFLGQAGKAVGALAAAGLGGAGDAQAFKGTISAPAPRISEDEAEAQIKELRSKAYKELASMVWSVWPKILDTTFGANTPQDKPATSDEIGRMLGYKLAEYAEEYRQKVRAIKVAAGVRDPQSLNKTTASIYVNEQEIDEDQLDELSCWSGYHRVAGTKAGFPGSCAKNKTNESEHSESCPHCGGEMVSEELMNEKKDACYYKVKSRYKVWPSAYASGALVKCRNKGASNWGNGGKKNEGSILEGINRADESLHDWFNKEKWVRMDTKGNIKGPCAKEPGEGKPKCLPQAKAHSLGKKGRASAAQRKRREDPNPDRTGKAINVDTKKKSN